MISLIPRNLTDLASFAQIAQTIVVVVGFLYGKRQLDELVKSRHLEAVRELIKELGTPEIREIRTWLMRAPREHTGSGPRHAPTAQDIEKVRKLAVAYDRIGLLVSLGIVPEKHLYAFQKDEVRQLWGECRPFIEHIRQTEHRPGYCAHFEYLGDSWLRKLEGAADPLLRRVLRLRRSPRDGAKPTVRGQ